MVRTHGVVLAIALAAALALMAAFAGSARADYGPGAQYQVEISANAATGSFWIWAELDPSHTSGDYQETDCIHLGHGGPNGAIHASGSVSGWSTGGGMLTMTGVKILGGLETATVSVPLPSSGAYGHSNGMTLTVTSALIPTPPIPVGATLSWSGNAAQVQLAP
jgi:hypothetical protein